MYVKGWFFKKNGVFILDNIEGSIAKNAKRFWVLGCRLRNLELGIEGMELSLQDIRGSNCSENRRIFREFKIKKGVE